MFTKRPDKYTTGLINLRNDCFANSSVQAYSALPGLTDYLNKMLDAYDSTVRVIKKNDIDLDSISSLDDISKFSHSKFNSRENAETPKRSGEYFKIPLHVALAKIVKKLQETQMTTRTISVWTFLHEIERIYSAKISRSQHDAHELTQLINETLETENIVCFRFLKGLKTHFEEDSLTRRELDDIEFPDFPFSGLLLSQMKCLETGFVSKPNITPFLMLTLHPPQELSTDLEKLLDENESETINEYQCLKCRVQSVVSNETLLKEQGHANSEEEEILVQKIFELNDDEQLFINEDLSPDLEEYLKNYDKNGLKISDVTSTVFRQTHILKPPKVFGIHLSRSAFNGVTATRNSCRVAFSDKLSLSIDESYLKDLQKFQQNANDATMVPASKSKVLTTDSEDMEDENVQREDVDEKGDDEEETDNIESSDAESQDSEVGDAETITSSDTDNEMGNTGIRKDTLNSAPISEDQTDSLLKHFSNFKFNENNVYRYRLKAIIRHQGSHVQGHYECYKRKPLYVKDSEGSIIKLSPEIDEELLSHVENSAEHSQAVGATSNETGESAEEESEDGDRGTFRRKLSIMMGRRPSIYQADPNVANVQEVIKSGLATPAEVTVDGGEYFSAQAVHNVKKSFDRVAEQDRKSGASKIKMKKIQSLIKFPYWRVGDSIVTEVSRSAVLFETASVYMLYFERIDRK